MKKIFLFIVFGFMVFYGRAQQLFQKQYTLGYESYLNDVVENATDSCYYFIGRIKYIDTGSFVFKPFILKTDKWGNLVWCKIITLSPTLSSGANFVRIIKSQSTNQFVIMGGSSGYVGNQLQSINFIITIDSSGSIQDAKSFNLTNRDAINDIIPTFDGGYIITGGINLDFSSYSTGKILLLKLDNQLNQQWAKVYGDTAYNLGESVIQLPDSGFMISGNTSKYDYYDPDPFVMRTDVSGNQNWFKILKDTMGEPWGSQLAYTIDSNVVFAYTSLQQFGGDVLYFLKMDTLGNIFWQRVIGSGFSQYKACSDGGFLFCQGRLWKVDSTGNHVWMQQYNTSAYQYGGSRFDLTKDSGIIIAGSRFLSLSYSFIQKTDSVGFYGCLGTTFLPNNFPVFIFNFDNDIFPDSVVTFNQTLLNVATIDSIPLETVFCSNTGLTSFAFDNSNIQIFPNPVFDILKIEFSNINVGDNLIQLTDVTGRVLLSKKGKSNFTEEINMAPFNSGLYLLKIFNADNYIIKKVVKQ